MASNARNLSRLLGSDTTVSSAKLAPEVNQSITSAITLAEAPPTQQINTSEELPLSGNDIGDQAYVAETGRMYIWTGSGWYNIALINTNPSFDSGGSPESSYLLGLNDSGYINSITISLLATDPEEIPITYSAILSDSASNFVSVTQDSSVFTVTPLSVDSIQTYDSGGGTFSITFRASDGVNLATALSEFTVNLVQGGVLYKTPGTYTWTVPNGVNSISVVCVGGGGAGDDGNSGDGGGGGGAGGALAYANSISVTPGETYTVVVGQGGDEGNGYNAKAEDGGSSSFYNDVFNMTANGGEGGINYPANPGSTGGTFSFTSIPEGVETGGGNGGDGGGAYDGGGGGGGAGGYDGRGGHGSGANSTKDYQGDLSGVGVGSGGGGGATSSFGTGNNGGGDGGIGQNNITGGGGGGVNIFNSDNPAQNGGDGNGSTNAPSQGGDGGWPGGGGGGSFDGGKGLASSGGHGAVRIVYGGNTRKFPLSSVTSSPSEEVF